MSNFNGKPSLRAIEVALATLLLAMSREYVPTTALLFTWVVSAMSHASCLVFWNTMTITSTTNSKVVKSSLRMMTRYLLGSLGTGLVEDCRCCCNSCCGMLIPPSFQLIRQDACHECFCTSIRKACPEDLSRRISDKCWHISIQGFR